MKRVIVAVLLLGIAAALCIGALWEQQRVTVALLGACDELEALYDRGATEDCLRRAEALSSRIEEDTRLFPFFLRHERMETIFQHAAALPHLIDDEDPADFRTSLSAIRIQLEILLDNEWPLPENIL